VSRSLAAPLAACLLLLAPACPVRATGMFGDTVEATCSAATKGSVTNSTVTIVCGIPTKQAVEMMRLAASPAAGDRAELLRRLDAMIPAESRLRAEAIARFFTVLGEGDVPPKHVAERLVEIAGHYQQLRVELEVTNSADPEMRQLKAEAAEALDAGDFARTEALLNEAKARKLSAIERRQAAIERQQAEFDALKLSAADDAAQNGDLMVTQLRYAEAARYYAEAVKLTPERYVDPLSDRLTRWGQASWRAGDYGSGLDAARRALSIEETKQPTDDVRLGSRLNNLALILDEVGRYAEAEPLYKRALAIREKALGPGHPELATALNNLAELYRATGRLAEAEPLYRRAVAIDEEALPPDHPGLATNPNNLAGLYRDTGRYAEAEPLHRRALAIREKALPPDHPDIAQSLNNLAGLYEDTGRDAEAEPLYRRAIAILEKRLPADHPHLTTIRENYAALLDRLGRADEAAALRAGPGPRPDPGLSPLLP
jgi:tetratricopeptide (TPR) repeat protein